MAAKRKKPAKLKRALKDRTKGVDSSYHAIKPKVLASKVERRKIDTSKLQYGRVTAIEGRTYYVEEKTADSTYTEHQCVPSRSIVTENPNATLLAVGDTVWFRTDESDESLGIIVLVEERKTKLARSAVGQDNMEQVIGANIDQLVLVLSVAEPKYKRALIDRYLVAAQKGGLDPIICINKIDLGNEEKVQNDLRTYSDGLDIPVMCISAVHDINIEALRERIANKTSILSGPSGAGKSTIINILFGSEVQVTADMKKKSRRGQHITTFARMFRLPGGGYILDTPGIREFGIWDITRDELAFYFQEFDEYLENCKFTSCTHTHEPECAVKDALAEGVIDARRYESYTRLLDSLRD